MNFNGKSMKSFSKTLLSRYLLLSGSVHPASLSRCFVRAAGTSSLGSLPVAFANNIKSARDAQDAIISYGTSVAIPGQVRSIAVVKVVSDVLIIVYR